MQDIEQLESLVGNPTVVMVRRRDPATGESEVHKVAVSEVTMKNFCAFSSACAPFFGEFGEAGRLGTRVDQETGDKTPPEEFALFHVLADHSDAFMHAAALVSDKPVSFYQSITPDQFFEVAAAVVKVNGDFFVRSLAPVLMKVGRALGTIGLTTSSS